MRLQESHSQVSDVHCNWKQMRGTELFSVTEKSAGVQELGTNIFQEAHVYNILVLQVQVTYYHPPTSTNSLISHPGSAHAWHKYKIKPNCPPDLEKTLEHHQLSLWSRAKNLHKSSSPTSVQQWSVFAVYLISGAQFQVQTLKHTYSRVHQLSPSTAEAGEVVSCAAARQLFWPGLNYTVA